MIEVSSEALSYMKDLFDQAGQPEAGVRIAVVGNAGLGLLVDHAGEGDFTTEQEGLPIIIDRKLLDYCKSIKIRFKVSDSQECGTDGYIIEAENSL